MSNTNNSTIHNGRMVVKLKAQKCNIKFIDKFADHELFSRGHKVRRQITLSSRTIQ